MNINNYLRKGFQAYAPILISIFLAKCGNTAPTTPATSTVTTNGSSVAKSPVFSPYAGAYATVQNVTISSGTTGAAICYTVDGSTPSCNTSGGCLTGTTYTVPIIVGSQVLTAIACASGSADSAITSGIYTITTTRTANPYFSPASGSYTTDKVISIYADPGAAIYYTTDGTTPTTASIPYFTPITLGGAKTIKAMAIKNWVLNSQVSVADYKILQTAQVNMSLLPGNYATAQTVALTTLTPGATIYYTTNGTTPSTTVGGSTMLYGAPISVSANTTIKAIAASVGYTSSPVSSATYTIGGTATYALGGWVSGLQGGTLVLQNNGGDDLTLTANGPFAFPTPLVAAAAFNVTVLTQPLPQTCRVDIDNTGAATGGAMPAANFVSVSVSCSPVSLPIADTGQTSCWDTAGALIPCLATGMDGAFSNIPFARNFSVPTAHATYTTNYTTTDYVTGLVWKTCSEGQGEGTGNCQGAGVASLWGATTANWTNAGLQCRALNDANAGAGYAGRTSWRLPAKKELESLVHYQSNASIDWSFPGSTLISYWSSTTLTGTPASAWHVNFGSWIGNNPKTILFYVRCVSGP